MSNANNYDQKDFIKELSSLLGPVFMEKKVSVARMRNFKWVQFYNDLGLKYWKLPQWRIRQHLAEDTGLKVSNKWWTDSGIAFVYIDIDTHDGKGKTGDVEKLFSDLKSAFHTIPGPIITSRGGSAWLPIQTRTITRPGYFKRPSELEWNSTIDTLQDWLQQKARLLKLDLSGVEVKGKVYCPILDHNQRAVNVQAGDLFKCPPSSEWLKNPIQFNQIALLKPIVESAPPIEQDELQAKEHFSGSFKPALLSDRIVDNLPLLARKLALYPNAPKMSLNGRYRIDGRRLAETVLALTYIPCLDDRSKAIVRIGKFISTLFAQGIFQFGCDFNVIKTVRDWMSNEGWIDWTDNNYDFSTGQACCWDVSPKMKELLEGLIAKESEREDETLSLITLISRDLTGEPLIPVLKLKSVVVVPYWTAEAYNKPYEEYRLAA